MLTRNALKRVSAEPNRRSSVDILPKPPPANNLKQPTPQPMDIEDVPSSAAVASSHPRRWQPRYWRDHLDNIRVMRAAANAPVDTMGCSELADTNESPEVIRFQTLVSLMLSSQTKDEVNAAAMGRLKAEGLTVDSILKIDEQKLEQLLKPVSFYKRKTQYLKSVARTLTDEYNGDIPRTVEGLCQLQGVGPKMAHLCMLCAWKEVTGIGVDTHVHRISNRLGWVPEPTKEPEQTRKALEDWLPRDLWVEVNKLLVGFGQTICAPVRPKCTQCDNQQICPYAIQNM